MIPLLVGAALASPLDAHLLYFIMIDRFQNGNEQNDETVNKQDPQAFHGGDLDGIIQKLPWLKEMGVDAIWMTPFFEMQTELIK